MISALFIIAATVTIRVGVTFVDATVITQVIAETQINATTVYYI